MQGREDETLRIQLDKHFEKNRNKTDKSTKKDDKRWSNTYAKIMAALIKETECLDDSIKIENFLDLG